MFFHDDPEVVELVVIVVRFELVDFDGFNLRSTGYQEGFQIMQITINVIHLTETKLSNISAVLEIRKPFPLRVLKAKSVDVMLVHVYVEN